MINRMDVTFKITDVFLKRLKQFINQEMHIKLEGDDNGVLYIGLCQESGHSESLL